jgi:hypothetical protein
MESEQTRTSEPSTPLVAWEFSEFNKRQRPTKWWLGAGIVWLALVIWALLGLQSFLFLLILLFGAIIFITQERREPDILECRITLDGVEVDDRLYPYDQLVQFYIIYHPGEVTALFLDRAGMRPTVSIPLNNQEPAAVREALASRLKEDIDTQHEPLLDQVARRLGLH